jgi:hypothetical protein
MDITLMIGQLKKIFPVFLGLLAFLLFLSPSPKILLANTAAQKVEMEIEPKTLQIRIDREFEVAVVVRNISPVPLSNLNLSCLKIPGLSVQIAPPSQKILPPHSAHFWTVKLEMEENAEIPENLWFRLIFLFKEKNDARDFQDVAFASIKLIHEPRFTIEKMVSIKTEKADEPLMEYQTRRFYLFITNTSSIPVQVKKAVPILPPKLTVREKIPITGKTLSPLQQYVFPLEIRVEGGISPGEHLIVYDIDFQWHSPGKTPVKRTGNLLTSFKIKAKILGESDLLTTLGVPSFLLLPGFLVMITLGFLCRIMEQGSKIPGLSKPEFWLFAISLSIVMGLLYPAVTRHNYLKGYGLSDIVLVWSLSIILTVLGYFLYYLGRKRFIKYKEEKTAEITISQGDRAIDVLTKLNRIGLGVTLTQVELKLPGEELQWGFLLTGNAEPGEKALVGPAIKIKWLKADEATTQLRREFESHLKREKDMGILLNLLNEGIEAKQLELKWDPGVKLKGPTWVKGSDVKLLRPRRIIEEDE